MILKYFVKDCDCNFSINHILKVNCNFSSRLLNKVIKKKLVFLNDQLVDTRKFPNTFDIISVNLDYSEDSDNVVPTKMDLDIVYEDDALLILNKPAGIATHPSVLHFSDSLSNGVKWYFNSIKLYKKIRPVNRLDLNTSGLIIFAKNEYIQECLIKQMENKTFKKEYLAICTGIFKEKCGTINAPIARKNNSIIERCINTNGQSAITHYSVIKEFDNLSLVKCTLETGRTHQIRVHMAYIGHSLLGDELYGKTSDLINRQSLHSFRLSFLHPISGKKVSFEKNIDFFLDR